MIPFEDGFLMVFVFNLHQFTTLSLFTIACSPTPSQQGDELTLDPEATVTRTSLDLRWLFIGYH